MHKTQTGSAPEAFFLCTARSAVSLSLSLSDTAAVPPTLVASATHSKDKTQVRAREVERKESHLQKKRKGKRKERHFVGHSLKRKIPSLSNSDGL